MVAWRLEGNDYGNAIQDDQGNFIKVQGEGVLEELWQEMVVYADKHGWKAGDYKKLNLPFETKILAQPKDVRERMAKRVEDFVYNMLTNVFNAGGTGTLGKELLAKAGSYDLGPKGKQIEDPANWTTELIIERAKTLVVDKGPEGDFDD
jgi:fructose-bisphosphate aldolase class II